MTNVDVAAHILWVLPVSFLCMQYGLDMIMEAVVPMSKKQIARRIAAGQW